MRRASVPLLVVVLAAVLVGGTAYGKPAGRGAVAVSVPVTGTFTPPLTTETVPFTGTLTVEGFLADADGQLALVGTLTDAGGLFEPLAVTVVALASASFDDATGGCSVVIGTTSTLVQQGFLLFLEGTSVDIGQVAEPDLSQELCQVVRAVDKDPGDQAALARALNRVLGMDDRVK
jgi:hypothetical protein